jgi:hypothetical protein
VLDGFSTASGYLPRGVGRFQYSFRIPTQGCRQVSAQLQDTYPGVLAGFSTALGYLPMGVGRFSTASVYLPIGVPAGP